MEELIESILEYGILVPGIARSSTTGETDYELIVGHRRKYACMELGIKTMPVIVRELSDDESTLIMVDSNIQREQLLYSEKAFAYKMKYEALKRQGRRSDLTLVQIEPKLKKRWAAEIVAAKTGENMSTIKRYIRLTYLKKYLLELVDKGEMPFTVGVELSYLSQKDQSLLLAYISDNQKIPNGIQAKRLKEISQERELTLEDLSSILELEDGKPIIQRISFTGKQLKKYFPEEFTKEQMEEVIFRLLEDWSEKR